MGHGGDVMHGLVIAVFASTAEKTEAREILEGLEAARCERRTMPEEAEGKKSVQVCESGESGIGEGTVDDEMRGRGIGAHEAVGDFAALPRFEGRVILEQRQSGVGDALSGLEAAKVGLAGEGTDGAIACRGSQQVHFFEMFAEGEIGHAGIGDVLLPAHLKSPEVGQMAQELEAAIGDLSFPSAEIELAEARQAGEVSESGVSELERAAEMEMGHMVEGAEALERGVGHAAASRREPAIPCSFIAAKTASQSVSERSGPGEMVLSFESMR